MGRGISAPSVFNSWVRHLATVSAVPRILWQLRKILQHGVNVNRKLCALPVVLHRHTLVLDSSLPSNRHHRSSGDCLEGKRENYQVCSVQYCVQQLYTVNCTHI